ncbi:U-box domain-containing protein 27 [Spatholobus suberectus]|nr:U-box domain-containing protein 27 [Spatholobus suberectus]
MKSLVSLCTGVIYDYSNIQNWLDGGNNTCPATMQVLQTKDFIPNRTLQSLIQIWSDSVCHQTVSELVPSPNQALYAIANLQIDSLRSSSLAKLLHFAKDFHQNKLFLTKAEGFVNKLLRLLDNVDARETMKSIEFLEQVVIVLGLILEDVEDCEGLKNSMLKEKKRSLDTLLLVLRRGGSDSKIASASVL